MPMTIQFSPVADDYECMRGTIYDPEWHQLLESGWCRSLSRVANRPYLFVYYHRGTGNFVLANWIHQPNCGKGPGLMTELESSPYFPDYRPEAWGPFGFYRQRLRPIDDEIESLHNAIVQKKKLRAEMTRLSQEERDEVVKWLKRQGLDHVARGLERGETPFMGTTEGGARLEATREFLAEAARRDTRKIYV